MADGNFLTREFLYIFDVLFFRLGELNIDSFDGACAGAETCTADEVVVAWPVLVRVALTQDKHNIVSQQDIYCRLPSTVYYRGGTRQAGPLQSLLERLRPSCLPRNCRDVISSKNDSAVAKVGDCIAL